MLVTIVNCFISSLSLLLSLTLDFHRVKFDYKIHIFSNTFSSTCLQPQSDTLTYHGHLGQLPTPYPAMVLFARSFRRRYLRLRSVLLSLTIILLLDVFLLTAFRPHPLRSATLPAHLQNKKIFIASIHRNSEYMLRLYWNSALLRLCTHLGPENVFVSILESGSLENTKGALLDLERQLSDLGVESRIELGMSLEESTLR